MARKSKRGTRARAAPPQALTTQSLYGRHTIEEALRARRRRLVRLLIREGPFRPELEPLVALARAAGVPVAQVEVDALPGGAGPAEAGFQGVVLEAGPLPEFTDVRELARPRGPAEPSRRLVALDGVEDPQNVGALARVADAAGIDGLILTRRRAPPLSPALARASAGAIEWLPVARVHNLGRALTTLKEAGFWVIGADPEASESLYELADPLLSGDLVVVLGAEGKGIRTSIRGALDHPIRIPMLGEVASLNVATAGAVMLFELLRRSNPSSEPKSDRKGR
ncbi:MAG: RNA methyltransferase [Deltaproteobacteria bacterium]|nr:RNA methyltransferase [Deltaproteobacteria bacterium]